MHEFDMEKAHWPWADRRSLRGSHGWSVGESGEARPLPEAYLHTNEPVPPCLRLNWWHSCVTTCSEAHRPCGVITTTAQDKINRVSSRYWR